MPTHRSTMTRKAMRMAVAIGSTDGIGIWIQQFTHSQHCLPYSKATTN